MTWLGSPSISRGNVSGVSNTTTRPADVILHSTLNGNDTEKFYDTSETVPKRLGFGFEDAGLPQQVETRDDMNDFNKAMYEQNGRSGCFTNNAVNLQYTPVRRPRPSRQTETEYECPPQTRKLTRPDTHMGTRQSEVANQNQGNINRGPFQSRIQDWSTNSDGQHGPTARHGNCVPGEQGMCRKDYEFPKNEVYNEYLQQSCVPGASQANKYQNYLGGNGSSDEGACREYSRRRYRKEKEPDKFDGKSVEWQDYEKHFEQVALWNGWSEREKATQLVMSLRGVAERL